MSSINVCAANIETMFLMLYASELKYSIIKDCRNADYAQKVISERYNALIYIG